MQSAHSVASAPVRARSGAAGAAARRVPGIAGAALVAVVMVVLFGPVLLLALFSFNDSTVISLPWEGFTTRWYSQAWGDPDARLAVVHSLVVAGVVTPVCLVLGTLAAFGVTRFRFRGRGGAAGLLGAPLVVPWLVIGVAGLLFFGQLNVDLSLYTIGLMHIVCTFPLVVAIISAGLVRFDRKLEEAAIDLGASQFQMLRRIVLPQLAPALAASAIFAFSWSFNNFEISFFTGGYDQTFPVWVYSILRHAKNLPIVNAVSTVISVAQVFIVFGAWWLLRRLSRSGRGEQDFTDLVTGGLR